MTVILDTGILFAHFNTEALRHQQACELFELIFDGRYGKPIVLDYIFDELVTLLQSKSNNKEATRIGELLLDFIDQDAFEFISVNMEIFKNAWQLFAEQTENGRLLSFTDCCILKTANLLGITYIATFDGRMKSFHTTLPE